MGIYLHTLPQFLMVADHFWVLPGYLGCAQVDRRSPLFHIKSLISRMAFWKIIMEIYLCTRPQGYKVPGFRGYNKVWGVHR